MVNGFTPLPFGQVEQFQPFTARQKGLERQQQNVQAEQTQFQNDLTLTDNIRKLEGTDKALEFWKTTASSKRFSFDKINPLPGDFETIQVKDNGELVGFQRFDAQGNPSFLSRKEAGIPAAAPKERKGVIRGPGQAVTDPVTGEEIAPQLPLKPVKVTPDKVTMQKGNRKITGVTVGSKRHENLKKEGFTEGEKVTVGGRADVITFTKGNRTVTARRGSAEAKSFRAQGFIEGKIAKPVEGQAFLLPDGLTFVTSFDGGKTYTTDAGEKVKIPSGSVPADIELRGEALRMMQAQRKAAKTLSGAQAPVGLPSAEEAALGGTGPFAALAAGVEAVLGGIGADLIFGKDGLFPETADNRQSLRIYKQLGKQALINSSRGAVWEQERIDKLFPDPDKIWRNPRTEARKFKILRETLLTVKLTNLQAIIDSTDPGEVAKLTKSNIDIDRLLAIIKSPGETAGITVSDEDQALLDKYPIEGQ